MGRNLIGYFAAKPDCKQYTVKIISDRSSDEFETIYLAGDSPFVVTYDTTSTPFEPLRLSRASINVVADEKFFDVFSEDPQGTRVVLEDSAGTIEWTGFLTSNLLNMPESVCANETFALEADDCLRTLENYKYQKSTKKQIVTFKDILIQIANRCTDIETICVDASLMNSAGTNIQMSQLKISEQNFYTSDTDEPWTLKQVLEELCKYLNLTAIQVGTKMILFDMQAHTSATVQGDTDVPVQLICEQYYKSESFATGHFGTSPNYMKVVPLRQSIIMAGQSDISLETIYNKIEVKDSFYEIDHFVPDMFEDVYLTNRQGDFWKCNQLSYSGKLKYLNNKGKEKEEEKDENEHVYYIRKFDHNDYESIYRDQNTLASGVTPALNGIYLTNVDPSYWVDYDNPIDYGENGIWYRGTYTVKATFHNTNSGQRTIHVSANLRYDWFDGEEMIPDYDEGTGSLDITLTASGTTNSVRDISMTINAEYPQKYISSFSYGADYRIGSASQRYPLTEGQEDNSKKYVGATIVDLATFDKPMSNINYNYETESNINFSRYLMIRQANKPDRQHPYCEWNFTTDLNPLTDQQTYTTYPIIFKLKDGYTNPFLYDNKAYLALDASAIFERYDREYINPDWTDENTNMNGLGLFRKLSSITTVTPALIFSLKVGNKYWSSAANAWTTTKSAFVVKLGTDKTEEDDVDFTGWWNEDHPVLNNISWTDWAGVKGYKIPLEVGLDMNEPIEFAVHMPSKMQVFNTTGASGSGINSMCWVKDLKIDFATKDSELYDNSDVVYRNIINSGAVNTLSDITMKITTYPGEGMHSYSNVAYNGVLIDGVVKTGLGSAANKLEEQKIKAYANQYSTNTIKQNLSISSSVGPLDRIKDPTLSGKYFGIIGTKIDYANGSQTVTLIETKPWSID